MQFFIFMICLFSGIISGTVYDVLYIARSVVCGVDKAKYTVKDKIFIIAADVLYCLVFAAGFVFVSVMFDFTSLRLYMLLGCFLGALIYLKSFHVIVAFCVRKVYNIVRKKTAKRKARKHSGRTKAQPHGGGNNGERNTADSNFGGGSDISGSGTVRNIGAT